MSVRDQARRIPGAAPLYRKGRRWGQGLREPARAVRAGVDLARSRISYERLPAKAAVRLVYQVLLLREPDPGGFADNLDQVVSARLTHRELAQSVRGSEEFQTMGFSGRMLGASIHAGRCQFIRSLPRAARIVDLGGTHLARRDGALVALGYPYPFEELTIVDLPSDDRHDLYKSEEHRDRVESRLGPVTYRYQSMTDLSTFADSSIDLVYSGQSIEHVTTGDAKLVLEQVVRILRPGGVIAIDTPNARVTRVQQAALIDPDHKVEYTWPELQALITDADLEVTETWGLNYAGNSVREGRFDWDEAARNWGLHAELEDCYILAVMARKPLAD